MYSKSIQTVQTMLLSWYSQLCICACTLMCRWDHSILTHVHIHVQHMDTYTRHIPTHLWVHIFMHTEEHNTSMHTHRYMHTQGTMHMHMTTYSIYANIHKQTRLHTNAIHVWKCMHAQSMCMYLYTGKETTHTRENTLRLPIFCTPVILNCPLFHPNGNTRLFLVASRMDTRSVTCSTATANPFT